MPSSIEFYILENANERQAMLFVCDLVEKLYEANESALRDACYARSSEPVLSLSKERTDSSKLLQKTSIHVVSLEKAELLDSLLWTFRDISFLPHQIHSASENTSEIEIGFGEFSFIDDVLINISDQMPPINKQYKRIIEIVFSDPLMQQLARERYKQYRQNGYELITHKLKAPFA